MDWFPLLAALIQEYDHQSSSRLAWYVLMHILQQRDDTLRRQSVQYLGPAHVEPFKQHHTWITWPLWHSAPAYGLQSCQGFVSPVVQPLKILSIARRERESVSNHDLRALINTILICNNPCLQSHHGFICPCQQLML